MRSGEEAAWFQADGTFVGQGSFVDAVGNVPEGGTILLLEDVSLESPVVISKRMTISSYDAENICTIKNTTPDQKDRNETGRIFTVNGGPLSLSNVILDGGRREGVSAYHPLVCVQNVGAMLGLGAVLQNAENLSDSLGGGAINIRLGQVIMYDGAVITSCKAKTGGGVEINSKGDYNRAMFGMAGGKLEDCEAVNGGGLYVNIGMFQMQGGEISGNRAVGEDGETSGDHVTGENIGNRRQGGGGIYIAGESNIAAVLVGNGKIAGNGACNGGGVLLQGRIALLQMQGGTIGGAAAEDGNKAQNGGGISVINGNLKLYGGTVTGNTADMYGGGILGCPYSLIELQGAPKVYDNTAGDSSDRFDNLYLDGNGDGGTDETLPVALTGPLTDGVRLGLSRWIRPDEGAHPYRDMIVSAGELPQSSGTYKMTEADAARLVQTLEEENRQLCADNMERYAFVSYEGKIVMILPVGVTLNKETLVFAGAGETDALLATVTPGNALIKDVKWSSSDETVAKVDENGVVTAVGAGEAVITVTTVSPYRATDVCAVKVAVYHRLTTRVEPGNGKITYMPDNPFLEGQKVRLAVTPDKGYQLQDSSLKAFQSGDESVEVKIDEEEIVMPGHDVTVMAVFEPIVYPITYDLDGGTMQDGESNPTEYTIESAAITLKNPEKTGYTFKGWTGTELTAETESVTIPAGSTGARAYTAVWEKKPNGKPKPGGDDDKDKPEDNGSGDEGTEDTLPGITEKQDGNNAAHGSVKAQRAETVSDGKGMKPDSLNPQTGNDMAVWVALALASVFGLLFLGVLVFSCIKILAYNRDLKESKQELTEIYAAAGIADKAEGSFLVAGTEKTIVADDQIEKEAAAATDGESLCIDFENLLERNEDIRGWLVCNGGIVNYPVVQAGDNDYYLRHSFLNRVNRAGCIFMDYRNASFEGRNVVIYGHNNTDRTMFGSLKDVFEDSFWEEEGRDLVYLADTENRLRIYQIFSCYVTENETFYITTSFADDETYESFLETINDRSQRECGVDVTGEDKILTLSTCYGKSRAKKRLVVHAKEVF